MTVSLPTKSRPMMKACARPSGLGLRRVVEAHAEPRAVAEQLAVERNVLRRGDDEDVADPGEHQHRDRIIDHRLVVDRQELLVDRAGHRIEPRA